MALTPIDIHNKEFRRTFRGYDEAEVDDFLDEVIREFESLLKEQAALRDELRQASAELARYKNLEDSMNRALMAAQEAAEGTIANAKKQADFIIREAQNQARDIERQAQARVAEARARLEDILRETEAFKLRMRSLLLAQLDLYQPERGAGMAAGETAAAGHEADPGEYVTGEPGPDIPAGDNPDAPGLKDEGTAGFGGGAGE